MNPRNESILPDGEEWQNGIESEDSPKVFRKALRLMRALGVVVLVIAAFLYVMRDAADAGLLRGYYTFLGFTTLVAIGGWIAARKWKDSAGGRALLGMGAALLPVHMTQHGGFLIGNIRGDVSSPWYASGGELTLLMALSAPILLITTWLGYSAWLRKQARILVPLYLLTNMALLIPVREGPSVVWVGMGMAIPCFIILGWLRARNEVMGSAEGIIARVAFGSSFALLIGRCVMNGSPTLSLVAFALGLVGITLFYPVTRELRRPLLRNWMRGGGITLMSLGWFVWMWEQLWVHNRFILPIDSDGLSLVLCIPPIIAASTMLLFSNPSETKVLRRILGWIGVATLALGILYALCLFQAGVSLAVGALALMGAFVTSEKWMLRVGVATAAIGIVSFTILGFEQVEGVSWMVLATAGLMLVMAVSYLENRGTTIMRWIRARMEHYRDWQ